MEVKTCKMCGRLFNEFISSYKNTCPHCANKMEDKFSEIKKYIEDNPNSSISVVSNECKISVKQLEQWVREERLTFSEHSMTGIACLGCGTMIKSGKYCDKCKVNLNNSLNEMYRPIKSGTVTQSKDSAKMRFFK